MKKQSTARFIQMAPAQLDNLTTIVPETLATAFQLPKAKLFTAADLWSIQRQAKSRVQRRSSF